MNVCLEAEVHSPPIQIIKSFSAHSKITQAYQCSSHFLYICVPELRYRAPILIKMFFLYKLQNHSSVTLFTFCVYECLMNINFIFLQCSKTEILTPHSEHALQIPKSFKGNKNNNLCLCLK